MGVGNIHQECPEYRLDEIVEFPHTKSFDHNIMQDFIKFDHI